MLMVIRLPSTMTEVPWSFTRAEVQRLLPERGHTHVPIRRLSFAVDGKFEQQQVVRGEVEASSLERDRVLDCNLDSVSNQIYMTPDVYGE